MFVPCLSAVATGAALPELQVDRCGRVSLEEQVSAGAVAGLHIGEQMLSGGGEAVGVRVCVCVCVCVWPPAPARPKTTRPPAAPHLAHASRSGHHIPFYRYGHRSIPAPLQSAPERHTPGWVRLLFLCVRI